MTLKNNNFETFAIEFMIGGISAAVSKTFAGPIELIKIRLQSMEAILKNGAIDTPYTGIRNCASRIVT